MPNLDSEKKINIVWFKKDLRLRDHQALFEAQNENLPTVLLYVFEPILLDAPTSDVRHFRFIWQSLQDINFSLNKLNKKLTICHGNIIEVLDKINSTYNIHKIFSSQETGIALTFNRDLEVKKWCKQRKISWKECENGAIIRGLQNRSSWSANWEKVMCSPVYINDIVALNVLDCNIEFPNVKESLSSEVLQNNINFQPGGESFGEKYLSTFLNSRYINYSNGISKPIASRTSCSRISPYLTYGNLSMRQVYQATIIALNNTSYKRPLYNFISRLHWHCHFIQKFESECRIEKENFNTAYNSIRNEINEEYFLAWKNGRTGFPLVDANMRCLKETGYINFRMRALVVSFFTANLFQPWQIASKHLAKMFLDFDPGIHYPQMQMQACTIGTNVMRIYNPSLNSKKHDADGSFIKKWVPELANFPKELIHEPILATIDEQEIYNCILGKDYPFPIIDLQLSSKFAKEQIAEVLKTENARYEVNRILSFHVKSKKRASDERNKKTKPTPKKLPLLQQTLFMEEKMGE
jgi:deoxyribodipyrimidine photo-lyase